MQPGPIGCPKTSVRIDHYTLPNIAEKGGSHLYRSGSLKPISELFTTLKVKLYYSVPPLKKQFQSEAQCNISPSCYVFVFDSFWFVLTRSISVADLL